MKVHSHFLINPFNSFTMEDKIIEKVYCYDHPSAYNNHDALDQDGLWAVARNM